MTNVVRKLKETKGIFTITCFGAMNDWHFVTKTLEKDES